MKSSYSIDDVQILLKDITGMVEPLPTAERERLIQSGVHYSEMLPLEYRPSEKYLNAYATALENYSELVAEAIGVVAEKIYKRKGENLSIVSLARAGIPIGILIKRYLYNKYGINIDHYSISIIRGKGIDKNAISYILKTHRANELQFVDGWIGKGAILMTLKEALKDFDGISAELAVVSDPANLTELCGTHEDLLIPSSCLNAAVTGLISRSFFRKDIINDNDFHGAVYYDNLENEDLSEQFLSAIEDKFKYNEIIHDNLKFYNISGIDVVKKIIKAYDIKDINYIKPGIGEATRVLLRRVPWKILINNNYKDSPELKHIYQLAREKNVDIEISKVNLLNYKVCGIIKDICDV